MSKRMYHPCHKLSVPSAKIFWCRHCMQMFEDAISRWRHSKTCKGSAKLNREKDLNGQVIQLYMKPDKVSYRDNIVPGRHIVNYKPHIKVNSAELKCLICQRRFLSLDNIREHVKYPCRRAFDQETSDSSRCEIVNSELDEIEVSTLIKVRRVEGLQNSEVVPSPETGLSVLAEASKHIESLIGSNNNIQNNIGEYYTVGDVQPTAVIPNANPFDPETRGLPNSFGTITSSEGNVRPEEPQQPLEQTRLEEVSQGQIEPTVIVFQQEDGQVLTADSLQSDTIQQYLRELATQLPAGQVLQVQLGENSYQNYITYTDGEVIPVELITQVKAQSLQIDNQQSSQHLALQPEVAPKINRPSILQRSAQRLQKFTASTQTTPASGNQKNTVAALLRSALTLPQTPPAIQTTLPQLQNLGYTGKAQLQSKEISNTVKREETVIEETVEEHGYFLPSEQEIIF